MKKTTFNIGSVIQAIMFYNYRFFESSGVADRRLTDEELPPEILNVFEYYYELLLYSTLGRFAQRASPELLIILIEESLLQLGSEASLLTVKEEEIFSFLQYRVSATIELYLKEEKRIKN